MKTIEEIRADLSQLKQYDVVIFGSYITDYFNSRSDIDIAIITHHKDKKLNLDLWDTIIGQFPPIYDLRIFELFPLPIQMSVIDNYQVLFGNALELSEYFYEYRKIWKDVKYRIEENQFKNIAEQWKLLHLHD